MPLSLLLVLVSLADAISAVDADGYSSVNLNKNLRGAEQTPVIAPAPAPCRHHLAAPAPAPSPSIRILQDLGDDEEDGSFPTLSPVIVEYWDVVGDGYGNPNRPDEDVPTDQVEIVAVDDLKADTDTDTILNDGEGTPADTNTVNDKDDIVKSTSQNDSLKDDKKWVILVAVLTSAAFLLMFVLLVLVCRARRRNRSDDAAKHVVNGGGDGEKTVTVTPAVAAAAARMAAHACDACDPTETDRDFSEHPDIQEIRTVSDKESETYSV